MALTPDDLQALGALIDAKLDAKLEPINKRLDSMDQRLDGLELQLKSTERTLKNQIVKSESLILDEVERVHGILDDHVHDTKKHTA